VDEIGETFERLMRTGAGFGMHDGDNFCVRVCREGGGDLIERKNLALGCFDGVNNGAAAFHHVFEASAKNAVDAHNDFIAGLDEIDG